MQFFWPIEFEILDEWWEAAGMVDFVRSAPSFSVMNPPYPDDAYLSEAPPSVLIMLCDIKPVDRDLQRIPGVRLFASKERMIRILDAIRTNEKLPPIQVVEENEDGYRYRLCHGVHRFYASVAAEFTHIPAVVK